MCFFISVGVDKENEDVFFEILGKDFQLGRTSNASFLEQLESSMLAFSLSKNMCACDIYHDPLNNDGEGLRSDLIQSLAKLLRKIDRLIFVVHWYGGDIEKEKIGFVGHQRISIGDLLKDSSIIKPDEVVEITI